MELIRGRWSKKYINCPEDKRDYDIMRRGFMQSHENIALCYCEKFSPPELSADEKKEILEYWAKFGIKIYDYNWHRMYYHATGIHDPRFIPDLVAGLVVYEYYNDRAFEPTWRDKNMFQRLLPDVPMPKTLGRRIRGRYLQDSIGYIDSLESFAETVWEAVGPNKDIIIKNTRDTGFGKGVKKYHVSCYEDILSVLEQWCKVADFIIQSYVCQHDVLKSFNELSSNMIRICSWRHGNNVDIMFAAARVGVDDSFTDVSFVNGEERVNIVGITHDGYFKDKMIDQNGHFVKQLPGMIAVPAWDKIISVIKKNHLSIDNFDIVGWDFTVDETGEPLCFEWNISWPGTVLYQFANGPLYGDKTEEVFAFLNDEKTRYNYIPYYMKLNR